MRFALLANGNGQRRTQSDALSSLRQNLIESDKAARAAGNVDEEGCTCGDDIDDYHYQAFDNLGLPKAFYGGSLAPQNQLGNPVPYDPRGNQPYDDVFNSVLGD